MHRSAPTRLAVESLESRVTPATAASVNRFGDLVVTSDVASKIAITQIVQGTFAVTDNGNPVGAGVFTGVTRDLRVTTSNNNDDMNIDLGGFSVRDVVVQLGNGTNSLKLTNGSISFVSIAGVFVNSWFNCTRGGTGDDFVTLDRLQVAGNVGINVGNGANSIALADGSIAGSLSILTGAGTDSVFIGDGLTTLSAGSTYVVDGGDPNDTLIVNPLVTLRNLYESSFNTVILAANSRVTGYVTGWGGFNVANVFQLGGRVDQSVSFGGSGGADFLMVQATASIGGSLRTALFGGNDTVSLNGAVGGHFVLDAGSGDDSIDLVGPITGDVTGFLGNGNDTLNLAGTVGTAGFTDAKFNIDAGYGNDTVRLQAGSTINGNAKILLGPGTDTAVVDNAATFNLATINGGAGTDTFQGNKARPGLTLQNFETFI